MDSHIVVHFTTKQGVLTLPFTNEESIVLYRVIQEALTNAMRHGSVREVFVTFGGSAIGELEFSVTNPIWNPKPFQAGFGLTNIKKRVEEINGKLSFYQTENDFIVKGKIPMKRKEVIK